jgi:hypothetical protein
MEAALGLAHSSWETSFHPAGSQKRFELERTLEARRRSELQYLVDPSKAPRLIDEDIGMRASPRDMVSLKWAEDRLVALGFQRKKIGKICSFTKELSNAIVFGDLRRRDELHFSIALKPVKLDLPHHERRRIETVHYVIPDRWKHGLGNKLDAAIFDGVKELTPKLRVVSG